MKNKKSARPHRVVFTALALVGLASCGGGGGSSPSPTPGPSPTPTPTPSPTPTPAPTFSIGGSVTGLAGTVVLQQGGANDLPLSANGTFTFPGTLASGAPYAVTVLTQPGGQVCTVTSGSGTVTANITNVGIICANLYTVGGTVTGLTAGPLVLQNNLGNDLTISGNGSFTFSGSVASGGAYSVSVLTQPPGPDCVVTSDTGIVNANITSVAVNCTLNPATAFVPFRVGPTVHGSNPLELHLATTKDLARAAVRVASNYQATVGYTQKFARASNGELSNPRLAALVYQGDASVSGGAHYYALDLSGGSNLIPRQVGNAVASNCEIWLGYEDIDDPDSAFMLIATPTGGPPASCQATPADFVRIRLSDSPTTPPAHIGAIPGGTKQFIYRPDGTLAGTVVCDYATHKLVMYHDSTYTTSTPLMDGCYNFAPWLQPRNVSQVSNVAPDPTYAFLLVFTQTGSEVRRVDYTRSISASLHDQEADPFYGLESDAQYLYFTDRPTYAPTTQRFLRVRLDGTASAQTLLDYAVPDGEDEIYVVGQSATRLFLANTRRVDPVTQALSATIYSLNKSGAGGLTVLRNYADAPIVVRKYADLILVSLVHTTSAPNGGYLFSSDTEILKPDGTVLQPLLARSEFIGQAGGQLLLARDAGTDGLRGARVEALQLSSSGALASTPLKRPDGGAFTLPNDSIGAYVSEACPGMAAGTSAADSNDRSPGLMIDVPNAKAALIAVPNKDVNFVSGY